MDGSGHEQGAAAGTAQGQRMTMTVTDEVVCGYCAMSFRSYRCGGWLVASILARQGVQVNPFECVDRAFKQGGVEYRLSNGQGVRFNADGSLSGFLDPRR